MTEPSLKVEACYINGAWVGVAKFPVINPATGEVLAHVPTLGAEDTRLAIDAAEEALKSWSQMLAKERSIILRRWFDLMMAHKDALAHLLTSEQGKPYTEALGEIVYAASFLEFYAEEAKRVYGETIPSHKQSARVMVLKQPIGVVAAITPWNFPSAMITRKVAPALAAGCTIVVKPAEDTPLSALALAKLAEMAGVPKGVLNVLTGDAKEIGGVLCQDPRVRLLTFTGSTEVGRILYRQSADTVKKLSLELGGNAPFIVFEDADLDKALDGVMVSKYRNMGQTCVCANRIFVQRSIYDIFAQKLKERVEALRLGNGLETGVTQGPLINQDAVEKVEAHITDAVAKGAKVLTGGRVEKGTFFQPTILTGVTQDMRVFQEETFGPVAPLFVFDREEDVIALANGTPFGLASYFYTKDLGRAVRVAERLEFGMVGVNEGVISTELAPFGGVKQSGLGREGSHHGLEEYLELKYVLLGGIEA